MQNRLLAMLPPEDYGLVAPHLTQIDLERGRLLHEPGDRIDAIYFPHDGVVSMLTLMENGASIEHATIGHEGAIGLSAAIAPRLALSRALVQTPCRCARIGASQMQEAWRRSARIREMVDRHGEALLGHATQSAACNALHSVEARFCRWLLSCRDRIPGDTVALTQEFLADMLGVQRTTVTAVARSMQEKGYIRYRRGILEIVDREGLEACACECYDVVRRHYERLTPTAA